MTCAKAPLPCARTRREILLAFGGFAALLAPAGPARAQTSEASVILEERGTRLRVAFDRARLRDLPEHVYRTSTVWTEAVDDYTGVLLRDLLLEAGIDPETGPGQVVVGALDGYTATIAFREITTVAPMLAFLRNGAEMPLRAQGPFWLLFPFDDDPAFQTETVYARSVWQVSHLLVER